MLVSVTGGRPTVWSDFLNALSASVTVASVPALRSLRRTWLIFEYKTEIGDILVVGQDGDGEDSLAEGEYIGSAICGCVMTVEKLAQTTTVLSVFRSEGGAPQY